MDSKKADAPSPEPFRPSPDRKPADHATDEADNDSTPKSKRQKRKSTADDAEVGYGKDLCVGRVDVSEDAEKPKWLPVYAYLTEGGQIALRFRYHQEDKEALEVNIPGSNKPKFSSIEMNHKYERANEKETRKYIKSVLQQVDEESAGEESDKESVNEEQAAIEQVGQGIVEYTDSEELMDKLLQVRVNLDPIIEGLRKALAVRDDRIQQLKQELKHIREEKAKHGETGNAQSA